MFIQKVTCIYDRISEIVTMSPFGLTKSTLNQGTSSSQWYVDVSWTPDESQSGPNLFCYAAVDSERYVVNIKVHMLPRPIVTVLH